MNGFRSASLVLAIALCACEAKAPAKAAAPASAAPAPAPKLVTMVCRNSQTGASVECGTPNAVPVAVKTD